MAGISNKRCADFLVGLGIGFVLMGFGSGWFIPKVEEYQAIWVVAFGVECILFAQLLDIWNTGEVKSEREK